ncbi:MAG: hypothetical protein RBG13Loki_3819 [Promethearchaeota archaeon CR_4]|nr:MAG: hypothetical protein RBG13Loki_3819 [Candidatus Lokiarchaeota archaeon CR_4]
MATTISQAFDEFKSALEITESERESVIKRHEYIRDVLRGKLVLDPRKSDFLTGSYKNNTKIHPINDVDIMVVLDSVENRDLFNQGSNAILRRIGEVLGNTFPKNEPIPQSHSIGLKFNSTPDVDIVPARMVDFDQLIFEIPDAKTGTYLRTSPDRNNEIISRRNEDLLKKFIPVIKMLKQWKKNNLGNSKIPIKLKSFHLETLCLKILTFPFTSFRDGIKAFFDGVQHIIYEPCDDPAGIGPQVDTYLDENARAMLLTKFREVSLEIPNLLKLESQGQHQDAIAGWHKIFGDPFPKPVKMDDSTTPRKGGTTRFPPEGKNYTFGV